MNQKASGDSGNGSPGNQRKPAGGNGLHIGRVQVTRPMFAELSVYLKKDGNLGATVICHADGGKYGASKGVLNAFKEPGTYEGWAYVARGRDVVFRFLRGGPSEEPPRRLGVVSDGVLLNLDEKCLKGPAPADGQLVAFYSRIQRFNGHVRLVPTHVFPLDADHPALIARLIAGARLSFPEDADALAPLFDGLEAGGRAAEQVDPGQLEEAMRVIANHARVDEEYQRMARVQLSRRGQDLKGPAGALAPVRPGPRGPKAGGARKDVPGAGDVQRFNLRLD